MSRYIPLRTYATVAKDRVEVVDFRLTRLHSDSNGQSPNGPQPTQNPSEKALQSLIKELSQDQGLDQLVKSTATESSFRYQRYKELSGFMRGLTLNFPKITSLHRYAGVAFPTHIIYPRQHIIVCTSALSWTSLMILTYIFLSSLCLVWAKV